MQNDIARLRRKFLDDRSELFNGYTPASSCLDLMGRYSLLVDGVVQEIYSLSCQAADRQIPRTAHSGLTIVATGGYGRNELNPFSDIDLAFVPSEESDPWVEAAVHCAFKLVMDVFLSHRELRVGYSFRPIAEVTTWDLPTKTSLLDLRYICGDRNLGEALAREVRNELSPLDIMLEIGWGTGHQKSTPSFYEVEPNLKEGSGSLRGLHRARWIFKLVTGFEDPDFWPGLIGHHFLNSAQATRIQAAANWFWRARTWMHLTARKRSDVLIMNYQDQIARELDDCSAQDWLSRHFEHAEALADFQDTALRRLLKGPLLIDGIRLENGTLSARGGDRVKISPVRLIQLSQCYTLAVGLEDLQSLSAQKHEALKVSEPSPQESWAFMKILRGRRVANTLRLLARMGLVDRFIGTFSEMMRFVPPDPAHRYTVGEHSLRIVEHLELLRAGKDPAGSRFSELLAHCTHFDVLCLAALTHDSGKLLPGTDHSESGLELTRAVSARLGLAPEKQSLLEILVRHHLLLVRTARLQDLKSPGVIQQVAEKIPTLEALRHLYVFTYLDTRAVAERNWTSMDFRDLEDLYKKAQTVLAGESEGAPSVEDKLGLMRRRLVALHGSQEEEAVQRHCDSMPAGYILNTPLDEIAFHLQLLKKLEKEKVVLDVYNRPGDDYSELTVCTYDDPRPGMLAKIAGVLYGCGADIHKAQVFTMQKEKPVVLDTLWMRSDGMQVSENRAGRIRRALKAVLGGERTLEQFLADSGKPAPGNLALEQIDLRNDLSEEHTVVHIIARDSQGLLYVMTRTLSHSGLHIHSAKVATWNARAENNFYVTTMGGGQIADSELAHWRSVLAKHFEAPAAPAGDLTPR